MLTAKEYLAKKSRAELKGLVRAIEARLVEGMMAAPPKEGVDVGLRRAFGIPGGTMGDDDPRKEVVAKILALANWGDPDETPPTVEGEENYKRITLLLGETPNMGVLAKKACRELVGQYIAPEVVEEHGGFTDLATMVVIDQLFPPRKGGSVRTAKQEYFAKLADELIALLG